MTQSASRQQRFYLARKSGQVTTIAVTFEELTANILTARPHKKANLRMLMAQRDFNHSAVGKGTGFISFSPIDQKGKALRSFLSQT